MRAAMLHLVALLLAPAAVLAAPPPGTPLAGETVEVRALPAPLPSDPAAALWDGLPALPVLAAPQRTIRLHDKAANAALAAAAPRRLEVRAATDGQDLAVVLDWDDDSEDRAGDDLTDRYGDAAALQLPLRFGAGVRLPYAGMGDDEQRVAVFLERASPAGTSLRSAVGNGFGTLTRADLGPLRGALRYDRSRRSWRALFVRPLAAAGLDLRHGLVPFAVAAWDGAARERGGNKALSGWKFLRLPGQPLDEAYLAEQAWGHRAGDLGDPGRGRALFESGCAICHATAVHHDAAPGLAPDLSSIGLIATPGYLRDSIRAPSAVIVPNPNPRQHQDRAGRDPRLPWPVDEGFVWFQREPDGRKTSTMPVSGSPPQEVADLVAYLMTLGAAAPAGRTP
jgi:complex iron-sulfur molybdoenzyme family reductase subunit gamma